MMYYILSEKDIEEIIKKGKFDAKKYAPRLSVFHYTVGALIENVDEELDKISDKISYEELCEEISDNLLCNFNSYSSELLREELCDDCFDIISEYKEEDE